TPLFPYRNQKHLRQFRNHREDKDRRAMLPQAAVVGLRRQIERTRPYHEEDRRCRRRGEWPCDANGSFSPACFSAIPPKTAGAPASTETFPPRRGLSRKTARG
ncbi:MAG: hypothetical protein ACODAD_14940, partial [Planctomycetota bacterium]